MAEKKLRIKLVKSPIGYNRKQRANAEALGLRKLQQELLFVLIILRFAGWCRRLSILLRLRRLKSNFLHPLTLEVFNSVMDDNVINPYVPC